MLHRARQTDCAFAEFVNDVRVANGGNSGRQLVINALMGVKKVLTVGEPGFGALKRAEAAIKAWTKTSPSVSHPPLTWPGVLAVGATMLAAHNVQAAVALLVAYGSSARIGEVLATAAKDVTTPALEHRRRRAADRRAQRRQPDGQEQAGAQRRRPARVRRAGAAEGRARPGLCFPHATKTGAFQFAPVDNETLADVLTSWTRRRERRGETQLFDLTYQQFRTAFRASLNELGIGHLGLTPHSTRHGATTDGVHDGVSIEELRERGRWASIDMVKHYSQQARARAAAIEHQYPDSVGQLADFMETTGLWQAVRQMLDEID